MPSMQSAHTFVCFLFLFHAAISAFDEVKQRLNGAKQVNTVLQGSIHCAAS